MAASSESESIADESREFAGSSDMEDIAEQNEIQTRAPKRRRLSESDSVSDNDSEDGSESDNNDGKEEDREEKQDEEEEEDIPAPAPMPTLSRIKKKGETPAQPANANADSNPELIRDAIEIGLQSAESSFKALNIAPWLVGSLTTMAVRKPTAIQRACIPEILKGRDCIGGSRTGSGKTIAFAVPMLQEWARDPVGIFGLVLTPTRLVFFPDSILGKKRERIGDTDNSLENWHYRSSNRCKPFPHRRA